jgi:hypothetical protein
VAAAISRTALAVRMGKAAVAKNENRSVNFTDPFVVGKVAI